MIRFIFNPFHPCLQLSHAIGNSYLDVASKICWLENGLLVEPICIMQDRKIVLMNETILNSHLANLFFGSIAVPKVRIYRSLNRRFDNDLDQLKVLYEPHC